MLRRVQHHIENHGWRIQQIPYQDPAKVHVYPTNVAAICGALGFIFAVGGIVFESSLPYQQLDFSRNGYIVIAVASLIVMLAGVKSGGREARRDWQKVYAKVIDRELRRAASLRHSTSGRGPAWVWRFLCEVSLNGRSYQVTPKVFWRDFSSEEAAQEFFDRLVSPQQEIPLMINPSNPLECELFADDVKDVLLNSTARP